MQQNRPSDRVKASPAARRVAKELGIDLLDVIGSGIDGRIQLEDVENHKKQIETQAQQIAQDQTSEIVPIPEIIEEPVITECELPEEASLELVSDAEEPESPSSTSEVIEPVVQPESITHEEETTEETIKIVNEQPKPESIPETEAESVAADEDTEEMAVEENTETLLQELKQLEEEYADNDIPITEDGEYTFVPSIPIYLSMKTEDTSVVSMLSALDVDTQSGLFPTILKATGAALKKIDSPLYEGKINVVSIEDATMNVNTAIDICCSKITEIKMVEQTTDPVLINVWDMTKYNFTKISKLDTDSINLFVMKRGPNLIFDLTCDEYVMDLLEATVFMDTLSTYIQNPSYMLV